MKIFATGRRAGKTQVAIGWALEHDSYIVCHSKEEATRVFHLAQDQGVDIHFPITYDELLANQSGRGVASIVIENVDMLLNKLSGGRPVIGFTATKDDDPA